MPAPRSTVVSGSESTYTGMRVALVMRSAKPLSKAPPPVSNMPWRMMSAPNSGGVTSSIPMTALTSFSVMG